MKNEERTIRFEYAMGSLRDVYHDDVSTTLTDLLADAMHWCTGNQQDFEQCLGSARRLYESDIRQKSK